MTVPLSEGDECPAADCTGELVAVPDGVCSCHTNPPCPACMEAKLVCVACGEAVGEAA